MQRIVLSCPQMHLFYGISRIIDQEGINPFVVNAAEISEVLRKNPILLRIFPALWRHYGNTLTL